MPATSQAQQRLMAEETQGRRFLVGYEYIAGFFDGEGCATMRRSNRYQIGRGRRSASFSAIICFTNTELEILLDIQKVLGGKIYPKRRKESKHAQAYELNLIRKADIAYFIETVGPYVRVKWPQLELVLSFIKLPKSRLDYIGRDKTWPLIQANLEDVAQREAMKQKLTELNKRGPRVCLQ